MLSVFLPGLEVAAMIAAIGFGVLALLIGLDVRIALFVALVMYASDMRSNAVEKRMRALIQAEPQPLPEPVPAGQPAPGSPDAAVAQPLTPALARPETLAPSLAPPSPAGPMPVPAGVPAAAAAAIRAAPRAPVFDMARLLRAVGLGTDWRTGLEAWLAGRLLAVVGGIALIAGAAFFLSLAFSRGWIGPEGRVLIGLAAGAALIALSAWLFERRYDLLGHVIVAVGLAVTSLAMFAATRLFGLVPVEIGLGGALVAAVAAAAIAIRAGSQLVAAFGLVAVLAAPPIQGASPTISTIVFLAVALGGTTAIALFRSWSWLPPVAFLLAAPQLASYVAGRPMPSMALLALGGFWLLHALAAAGEELRKPSNMLRTSSASLLVAVAALLVWGGLVTLDGDLHDVRAGFLVVVAAAHLALAGRFLLAEGDRHPFGLLAAGTGLAALAMAVPVQVGGPPVALAWAAEAAAVAWVAVRRRHPLGAAAATVLGALALVHLATIEYPLISGPFTRPEVPFTGSAGLTLVFELGALAVVGWFTAYRPVRIALAAVGTLLLVEAIGFELEGPARIAAWSAVAVLAVVAERRIVRIDPRLPASAATGSELAGAMALGDRALFAVACLAGAAAAVAALGGDLSPLRFVDGLAADFPGARGEFPDAALVVATLLVAATLAAGAAWATELGLLRSMVAAGLVVAYVLPFEFPPAASVVGWSAIAVAALVAREAVRPTGVSGLAEVAAVLVGLAALVAVGVVAPPDRLFVDGTAGASGTPFLSPASAALGAVAVALVAGGRLALDPRVSLVGLAAAGSAVVYLLSIGVVDAFQAQTGGEFAVEELAKQAQVGLSVLWAVLGVLAFVGGLLRPMEIARRFGLALLGVATAKVFLFDLAALDVAYRVLSFIGLGVLLLGSAYLYRRLRPEDASGAAVTGESPGPPAAPIVSPSESVPHRRPRRPGPARPGVAPRG